MTSKKTVFQYVFHTFAAAALLQTHYAWEHCCNTSTPNAFENMGNNTFLSSSQLNERRAVWDWITQIPTAAGSHYHALSGACLWAIRKPKGAFRKNTSTSLSSLEGFIRSHWSWVALAGRTKKEASKKKSVDANISVMWRSVIWHSRWLAKNTNMSCFWSNDPPISIKGFGQNASRRNWSCYIPNFCGCYMLLSYSSHCRNTYHNYSAPLSDNKPSLFLSVVVISI